LLWKWRYSEPDLFMTCSRYPSVADIYSDVFLPSLSYALDSTIYLNYSI
jgi:hypothetical protein